MTNQVCKVNLKDKVEIHTRFRIIIITLLLTLVASCFHEDEDDDVEVVSVDDLVWSAYRSPETFDSEWPNLVTDSRTVNCLHQYRDRDFQAENNKLLECGQLVTGSAAWNECHQEAEAFHNRGVIFNNIAGAITGPGRFDESQGYSYLILSKAVVTEQDWNDLIDQLRMATPEYECEYE